MLLAKWKRLKMETTRVSYYTTKQKAIVFISSAMAQVASHINYTP